MLVRFRLWLAGKLIGKRSYAKNVLAGNGWTLTAAGDTSGTTIITDCAWE